MFRQHKILCENKETVLYLFLYDQQIDLETMKIIFTQISSQKLESRILDYLETIIRDLYLAHYRQPHTDITNVINLY